MPLKKFLQMHKVLYESKMELKVIKAFTLYNQKDLRNLVGIISSLGVFFVFRNRVLNEVST